MEIEKDEKFNRIKAEEGATIPTATIVTEEEFFNIHGYIFETDLKVEATRLQEQHCGPRRELQVNEQQVNEQQVNEQQVDEQHVGNGIDNIDILCPKKILLKVKRLSMLPETLCPKKVVLRLEKLSTEVLNKYVTKSSGWMSSEVEKRYECEICCKKYVRLASLKEHIRKSHRTHQSYECSVCPKVYRSKIAFRHHQLIHKPRKCAFSCNICSKSYSHEGALKQHLNEHLGEKSVNVKKRRCQFCHMKFFTTQELMVHRATHTDLDVYQCEKCPMNFTTKGALLHHVHEHRTSSCIDKPFECYLCKRKFVMVHCLQNHMRIHTKKYDCRICLQIFDQETDLEAHMLTHSGKYRFECKECSKGFDYRTSFVRHVRIHTKEKPFQCEYCQKTFKEKDYLIAHKRTHTDEHTVDRSKFTWRYKNERKFRQSKTNSHIDSNKRKRVGKEFKCKICLKIITNENELSSHFDMHTGKYLFECSICQKGFDYGPNLYRHLRQHSGNKPYKCDRCPRRYGDAGSLKAHIRCHNGEKVECEICLKKFSEKGYLKIHRRLHSGERPFECTQCKTKFMAKQSLTLHTCFKCGICSRYFSMKYLIRRHMLVHLKKGLNVCNTKRC